MYVYIICIYIQRNQITVSIIPRDPSKYHAQQPRLKLPLFKRPSLQLPP